MRSSLPEFRSWKSQRWIAVIIAIFTAQLLLIYFLSNRTVLAQRSSDTTIRLALASTQWTEALFSKVFLATDPALFAVPGTHGFSGAAWLKNPTREYKVDNLFDHKESPYWLPMNADRLGNSLNQFVRTNSTAPILRAEDAAPRIQTRLLDMPYPVRTNSELRIEGDLASRQLLSSPGLVPWPQTNILSNSVAQVAVDQNGMVISTRLLSKSGSETADRAAMDFARQIQFEENPRSLVWGKLIFDWHTIPPAATNAPAPQKSR